MTVATPSSSTSSSPSSSSTATRRTLRFTSMAEILADVDQLAGSGRVVGLGTWSPAQVLDHVRRVMVMSREGVDFAMPLPLRVFGRVFKPLLLRNTLKPGIKIPKVATEAFDPPKDLEWAPSVAAFREEIAAASRPGAMTAVSPLVGPLSHADWERLHCRHAELHFGFIVPESGA